VGQTTGTIAGAAIVPGIGAPLGALVGTLAGLLVEHQVDKVREQKEQVELTQQLSASSSSQAAGDGERLRGQAARVWVDEQVHEGRLIAGHFEVRTIQ
jgi:outer membrane lipoprotein SlyB